MRPSNYDPITSALKRSFKKKKLHSFSADLSRRVFASASKVLSTVIVYEEADSHSINISDSLKHKYKVLKSSKTSFNQKCVKVLTKRNMKPLPNVTENKNENLTLPSPSVVLFPPEDVRIGWKSAVPVGAGFVNQGTTCYINSTLQALFHVPSFVNWLNDDKKHLNACERKNGSFHNECLVCAMAKTLQTSHKATGGTIRPRYIIEKIKIICKHLSACRQEDAHEFLRYLMEAMERSYLAIFAVQIKKLDNYSKETTPLNQLFGGYIRTEVTCLDCKHMSTTFQHFQDLILDIRQSSSVFDALENYFAKEKLDVDEAAYHCDRCKKKVPAHKKFSLEKAPNVLCIQLKRFNINSFYGGSKLSKLVSVEQNLDLTKFKHKSVVNEVLLSYRLVSMVFHHGPSANSGHYTAMGCTSTGSYYYFNDEQVCPASFSSYSNSPNAYIIFYELNKPQHINETNSKNGGSTNATSIVTNGYHNGALQFQTDSTFQSRQSVPSNVTPFNRPYCRVLPQKDAVKAAVITASSDEKGAVNGKLGVECITRKSPIPANTTTPSSKHNKLSHINSDTPRSLVPYVMSDSDDTDSDSDMAGRSTSPKSETSPNFSKCVNIIAALNSTPLNRIDTTKCASVGHIDSNNNVKMNGDVAENTNRIVKDDKSGKNESLKKKEDCSPLLKLLNKSDELNESSENPFNPSVVDKAKNGHREVNLNLSLTRNFSNNQSLSKDSDTLSNGIVKNNLKDNHITLNKSFKNNTTDFTTTQLKSPNVNSPPKTNGWIVSKVSESLAKSTSSSTSVTSSKTTVQVLANGVWTITDVNSSDTGSTSPKKMKSEDQQHESANRYTNINNNRNFSNYGYGGKVMTWNGETSYVNQEAENERSDSVKRNFNDTYDDEMDMGKIKKRKFQNGVNRNENGTVGLQRGNPIQQHYNTMNANKFRNWHHSNNNSNNSNNMNSSNNNNNNNNTNNNNNNHSHYNGNHHVKNKFKFGGANNNRYGNNSNSNNFNRGPSHVYQINWRH